MGRKIPIGADVKDYSAIELLKLNFNSEGTLEVTNSDQTQNPFSLFLHESLAATPLAAPVVFDGSLRTASFEAGHGYTVGAWACFRGTDRVYQSQVTAVNVNDVTFASPFDSSYPIESDVCRANIDMDVDGSTTPRVFRIRPPSESRFHATRVMIQINGSSTMDNSLFGDQPAIADKCVLRKRDGDDDTLNLLEYGSNGDLKLEAYDLDYDPKAPAGTTSLFARRSWAGPDKSGVVIPLSGIVTEDSPDGVELENIVDADLLLVGLFRIKVHGHFVQD